MGRKTWRFEKSRKKSKKRSRWEEIGQPVVLLGIIAVVMLVFYAVVYDPLVPSGQVQGVVATVKQPEGAGKAMAPTLITVTLDNGETVTVAANSLDTFEIGQRVTLQELQSRLMHRKEYRLMGETRGGAAAD